MLVAKDILKPGVSVNDLPKGKITADQLSKICHDIDEKMHESDQMVTQWTPKMWADMHRPMSV